MSGEKRRSKRRQVGQRAWVDFGRGTRLHQCFVKDMSDTGARLALAAPAHAPDQFVLQFSPDGSVGRRCEVRWRSAGEIGVKFVARISKGRKTQYVCLDC